MSTSDMLLDRIRSLPQAAHIKPLHQRNFLTYCERNGIDAEFHIRRAGGIGASEVGAIFNHYHKNYLPRETSNAFTSAQDISLDKLLLSMPDKGTVYTRRGQGIEQFIADVFKTRYGLHGKESDEILLAASSNTRSRFARATPDDAFEAGGRKILIDYKSSVTPTDKVDFQHNAQLQYEIANAQSNGVRIDETYIVSFHTSELMFSDLVAVTSARHEDPRTYDAWVKLVAGNTGLSGLQLLAKPIAINLDFGNKLVACADRFFNEYPMSGKTVQGKVKNTILSPNERQQAIAIEARLNALEMMKRSVDEEIAKVHRDASAFADSIPASFEWPREFPINVRTSQSFNVSKALIAMEMTGVDRRTVYRKTDKLNPDRVKERLDQLGSGITEDLLESELDIGLLKSQVELSGLSVSLFTSPEHKATSSFSRKKEDADRIDAEMLDVADAVTRIVSAKAAGDMEERIQHQVETFGMES